MTVDLTRLVRKLEWTKDGESFSAPVSFGEYRVACICGEWMWFFAFNPRSNEDRIDQGYGDKNTKPSAQAAANADHAARVIAAMDGEFLREMVGALARWYRTGCPDCGGDCASANPPVSLCLPQQTRTALTKLGVQP